MFEPLNVVLYFNVLPGGDLDRHHLLDKLIVCLLLLLFKLHLFKAVSVLIFKADVLLHDLI